MAASINQSINNNNNNLAKYFCQVYNLTIRSALPPNITITDEEYSKSKTVFNNIHKHIQTQEASKHNHYTD